MSTRAALDDAPVRWLDRPPSGSHWHLLERCGGPVGCELLASTASVALRVLTARAGELMVEGWSLDTALSTDVDVHLWLDDLELVLSTWECDDVTCLAARHS